MITIEPIIFCIRIGKNHNRFGDEYDTVCTAIKIAPDKVRIIGLVGVVTMGDYRKLIEEFKKIGIKEMVYERSRDLK